ncbi:TonB family protein [Mitsuaria sp. WAJ17]|uniref:TonB family protein n=1 Tax=Mitsuaria sp. WAJ17 TaxID=2761452 RepID=UPI001601AB52|nr:TonB family protein [Mitsuaria sp. WAJ17]MBB2486266.1 TonB family protein [Mitsuaria sp. WAJ17]
MNRWAASFAVLLHGGLLLAAGSGAPRPPAVQGLAADRPTLALRLSALQEPEARREKGLRPPTVAQALVLQPPTPLLIAPPELQPGGTAQPSPSPAALDAPSPERLGMREASSREPDPAPSPPDPAPQALVPAAQPPEHLACQARQAQRHYPALLRDRGIEGRVVVRVRVDENGRAAEVQVLNPSGWRLMDEAARQVATACAYLPARRAEQRLMAWIEYPVRFSLH